MYGLEVCNMPYYWRACLVSVSGIALFGVLRELLCILDKTFFFLGGFSSSVLFINSNS